MRSNLRRQPDLTRSPREEVDARLLGVLVGLEMRQLPEWDVAFMNDLTAALHFDCDTTEDCLAVWDYAAACHVSQMARHETTSPRERIEKLARISVEDLRALRTEVLENMDQVWTRATGGRQTRAARDQVWLVRGAAGTLMEWMSAREVHPPGSSSPTATSSRASPTCHYVAGSRKPGHCAAAGQAKGALPCYAHGG